MSSTFPVVGPQSHPSPVSLRIVHPPSEKLSAQVDKLSEMASQLLSSLTSMKEEEIITNRKRAQKLGAQQLRIELACDAELWDRDQVKRGHGTDSEDRSISVAIAKRAKEIGCSPKTIKRNAKIFSYFKDVLDSTVRVLPDKGYYQVALASANPLQTLNLFIERKTSMAKFTVADATRFLSGEKREREVSKRAFVERHRSKDNKALEAHILWAIEKIQREVKAVCPSREFSKSVYNPLILDMREYLDTMFSDDAKEALRSAWAAGFRKEDQMAKATGLSRAEVSDCMKMLAGEGEFMEIEQRGETEQAKGGHAKLWKKLREPHHGGELN